MSLLSTFQQSQAAKLSAIGMAPIAQTTQQQYSSSSSGSGGGMANNGTQAAAQRSQPTPPQQPQQQPHQSVQLQSSAPHRSPSPPVAPQLDVQQFQAAVAQQFLIHQYAQQLAIATMQQHQQQQLQQRSQSPSPSPPLPKTVQQQRPAQSARHVQPPPPPQTAHSQQSHRSSSSASDIDYAASVLGASTTSRATAAAVSSTPSQAPNPYARSSNTPPAAAPVAAAASAAAAAPVHSASFSAHSQSLSLHAPPAPAAAAAAATPSLPQPIVTPPLTNNMSLYIGPPIPAPPAAAAAAAARPAGLSAAPAGPTSSVVKSTTDAGVSISRSAPAPIEQLVCPECPPGAEVVVDPHQGVEVCTNCGLVIGQYISEESEWRTFSDRRGDDPNRVGGPEIGLLADAGLATLMGDSPNGLGSNLAKLQNKSAMSHNHRVLLDAFRKSSRISSLLSLPRSLTDRADELYKRVVESKQVRHRGADALIAACIFMVCKAEKVPRTIKEMCGVSDVDPKALGKCFKEMKRLGFHKALMGGGGGGGGRSSRDEDEDHEDECASYVARWGNHLRLPPRLIEAAKLIANQARQVLKESRDPSSLCGAALYIAGYCGTLADRRTYESIQSECGISTNTLRTVVKSIIEHKHSILPADFQAMHIDT